MRVGLKWKWNRRQTQELLDTAGEDWGAQDRTSEEHKHKSGRTKRNLKFTRGTYFHFQMHSRF